MHTNINHNKRCHSCESRNLEKTLDILDQVRGRLSQTRNDKLHKTYVVMHKHTEREVRYEDNSDLFVCSGHRRSGLCD
jgi:cupin superfamily acireductone dioxygenase involved in methionine salvage